MHLYAAGPVVVVVFRTCNVFYKIEGVPGKKPQVTSVNYSPLIVCSDCLVLICETKDYLKLHQESFRPLKKE